MSTIDDANIVKAVLRYVALGEAALIGLGTLITGVSLLQCILVIKSSAQNRTRTLAAVATVMHLAQVVIEWTGSMQFSISIIDGTRQISWVWIECPLTILTLLISLIVQSYFARITYVLAGQTTWFLALTGCCVLASSIGAIGTSYGYTLVAGNGFMDNPFIFDTKFTALLVLWLSGSFVFDMTLSTVLCYRLAKTKQQTVFAQTQRVISVIFSSTLETFSLTTFVAVLCLILVLVPRALPREDPFTLRFNILSTAIVAYGLPRFYLMSFLFTVRRHTHVQGHPFGKSMTGNQPWPDSSNLLSCTSRGCQSDHRLIQSVGLSPIRSGSTLGAATDHISVIVEKDIHVDKTDECVGLEVLRCNEGERHIDLGRAPAQPHGVPLAKTSI